MVRFQVSVSGVLGRRVKVSVFLQLAVGASYSFVLMPKSVLLDPARNRHPLKLGHSFWWSPNKNTLLWHKGRRFKLGDIPKHKDVLSIRTAH